MATTTPALIERSIDLAVAAGTGPHPSVEYLASLDSPVGRATQERNLNRIARHLAAEMNLADADQVTHDQLPWAELTPKASNQIRRWLVDTYAPRTVNVHLSALRGVLRNAWRLGLMDRETMERVADVKSAKIHTGDAAPKAGRLVKPTEIAALFDACAADQSISGRRDAAILGALLAGLRRAEVATLTRGDYLTNHDGNGPALNVTGKGDKPRTVYLPIGADQAIEAWLTHHDRLDDDAPLFCAINKGGTATPTKGINPQSVANAVEKRRTAAGVEALTCHDFRRTTAGDLIESADIAVAANILGHADIQTTRSYDRRGGQVQATAARTRSVPYRRATLDT